ncbi:hypothetical protein MKOR_32130 [Mycolicibacillus koreensis]|nr:hypothetical protein MKOR_32130 [Mycolicibacillus koreensis]
MSTPSEPGGDADQNPPDPDPGPQPTEAQPPEQTRPLRPRDEPGDETAQPGVPVWSRQHPPPPPREMASLDEQPQHRPPSGTGAGGGPGAWQPSNPGEPGGRELSHTPAAPGAYSQAGYVPPQSERTEVIEPFFTDQPPQAAAPAQAGIFGGPGPAPPAPTPQFQPWTGGEGHRRDDGDALVTRRRRPAASGGWRRWLSKLTGGRINPGPSAKQEKHEELLTKVRSSLTGVNKVAFVSAKGGVGKTTMTVALGSVIARERGDRVIAVDVNTDLGDLAARFDEDGGQGANIEQMASLRDSGRYARVREHTVQNRARLEALSSQNDPRSTYTLNVPDYAATMRILETHYNVVLLDCGTSITAPLFAAIADDVNTLVVVAAQNTRGVVGARNTLEWLHAHGFGRLLQHTVVTLNATDRGKPLIDLKAAEELFRQMVPEVVVVPYDPHLAEGSAVDHEALRARTRKALFRLAGAVADHYPVRHGQGRVRVY